MTETGRAWGVHVLTSFGVVAGVLALEQVWQGQIRAAFLWMMVAVLIDSLDGTLARRWQVTRHLPQIDGRRLDDMVDYFTWVIVPVLAMSCWGWLPPLIWCLPLLSSALGMSHRQAKTDDDYFRGFPSLWNVVALYLWHWGLPPWLNGLIILALSWAVLSPVRFIYPSKTRHWRLFNVALMLIWGVLVVLSLLGEGEWSRRCFAWSNAFPVYYLGMSFWLHSQDKPVPLRTLPTTTEEVVYESKSSRDH